MDVLSPGIKKVAEIFIAPVRCVTTLCTIFICLFFSSLETTQKTAYAQSTVNVGLNM